MIEADESLALDEAAEGGELSLVEKLLRRTNGAAADPRFLGREISEGQIEAGHGLDDALQA